ncbi:MAG TPA: hypothetical protein VNT99_08970 [Methylomirabilota bacterium]|nr:hypothetical protein [Methylomirabilota bacterium]
MKNLISTGLQPGVIHGDGAEPLQRHLVYAQADEAAELRFTLHTGLKPLSSPKSPPHAKRVRWRLPSSLNGERD